MPMYPSANPGSSFAGPVGFFSATPVAAPKGPYVQNYSNTSWTLSSYTSNAQTSAYVGGLLDLLQAARLSDLNTLRVAYENLRALVENAAQQHNSLVSDLKAYGLLT